MSRIMKPVFLLLGLMLLVTGCAIKPQSITVQEAQEAAAELQAKVQPEQEPLPVCSSIIWNIGLRCLKCP